MDEDDWDRLVEQLMDGDCTPFLGAGASTPTLPTGGELSRKWAKKYKFPFTDDSDLPEVAQYATVVARDPVTIRRRLARELKSEVKKHGEPDFTDAVEPHALLARLPLPVHLTTNFDTFMTRALEEVGKHPTTAICPWYRGAENDPEMAPLPPEYEPREEEPLVFHLHGNLDRPKSLVVAEQDYVEFLVNLAKDIGEDARRVVPHQVLLALTDQPLLFIGYSLRDFSFRTLFHGIVRAVSDVQRRRHVSVLKPDLDVHDPEAQRRAERYLTRYFDQLNISVYWGTAREFCTELHHRLESA